MVVGEGDPGGWGKGTLGGGGRGTLGGDIMLIKCAGNYRIMISLIWKLELFADSAIWKPCEHIMQMLCLLPSHACLPGLVSIGFLITTIVLACPT